MADSVKHIWRAEHRKVPGVVAAQVNRAMPRRDPAPYGARLAKYVQGASTLEVGIE
jgi:hypothetical protein